MVSYSIDRLKELWHLATLLHHGQFYGGPKEGQEVDYINHIGSVTFEVLHALLHEEGINEDLALACAVLHDTIEDTSMTYDGLKGRYGTTIADGVMALTKNEDILDKKEKMMDSLKRIQAQPREVWMVKLADRIANLQEPPHHWTREKKQSYREESQIIHEELKAGSPFLAQRLQTKIVGYSQYFME